MRPLRTACLVLAALALAVPVTAQEVGRRILVETGGEIHDRAEVLRVLSDGRVEVEVWGRLPSRGLVGNDLEVRFDRDTGVLGSTGPTRVEVMDPATGEARVVEMETPWLERHEPRRLTLEAAEVARLNAFPTPPLGEPYDLYGYRVDPVRDPGLAGPLARALEHLEGQPAAFDRTRPAAERAAAQRRLIQRVFQDNPMAPPWGADEETWRRITADPASRLDGRIRVGAFLEAGVGSDGPQAAAMGALMHELGREAGFDVLPVLGRTISTDLPARFLLVRLADGRHYIMDPAAHVQSRYPWAALEPLAFATYDGRLWANRRILSLAAPDGTPRPSSPRADPVAARPEPPRDIIDSQTSPADRNFLERVWRLAEEAHRGQRRKNGTAYIGHPESVARVLIEEMGVRDRDTLAAALLHDVVEDTPVPLERIRARFGDRVALYVDYLTKVADRRAYAERFHTAPLQARQVKVADRLHNMREVHGTEAAFQRRFIDETRELYLDLARETDPRMHAELLREMERAERNLQPGVIEALRRRVGAGEGVGPAAGTGRVREARERTERRLRRLRIPGR